MKQHTFLAKPFNDSVLKTREGTHGAVYIEQGEITQALLYKLGGFDQEIREVIWSPKGDFVTVILRLTCHIDQKERVIEEAGEATPEYNKDGRLVSEPVKSAVSDALKRCAMRIGCGLQCWNMDHYWLYKALAKLETPDNQPPKPDPAQQAGPQSITNATSPPQTPATPQPKPLTFADYEAWTANQMLHPDSQGDPQHKLTYALGVKEKLHFLFQEGKINEEQLHSLKDKVDAMIGLQRGIPPRTETQDANTRSAERH